MSAATAGAPAPAPAKVEYREQRLVREIGILVEIDGQPAGWIFQNGRDATFDFTLTDVGQDTPAIKRRFMTKARYGGRDFTVYRRGLDTVGSLDVLKERIEDLAGRKVAA